MNINWRNPKVELPKAGQIVWVLMQHWKKEYGQSIEIYCGEVSVSRDFSEIIVMNNDYIGAGSASWVLFRVGDDCDYDDCNIAKAWLPVSEMALPPWVKQKP